MKNDTHTALLLLHDTERAARLGGRLERRGLRVRRCGSVIDAAAGGPAPHAILVELHAPEDEVARGAVARLRTVFPDAGIVVVWPSPGLAAARAAFRAGAWDVLDADASDADVANCVIEAVESSPPDPRRPTDCRFGDTQGPHSHSGFLDTLTVMRESRQRTDRTLALVLFDLDRFHECNERISPAFGDEVLDWFRSLVTEVSRSRYVTVRYQADQFVTVMPDVGEDEAIAFAEQCRLMMCGHPPGHGGRPVEITATVGIVVSGPGCEETPHQLLQRARVALTHGKEHGGNRVVTWAQLMNDPFGGVSRQPASIQQSSHWMARLRQHLRSTHVESTRALVAAIDARDPHTRTHSQTVASYAEALGRRMELHGPRLEALRAAALLHDVGKIGLPDAILTKPGPLTEEEFVAVRRHPEMALDILRNVSFLSEVQPLILHHHERYDGRGYPFGLRGDRIPIGARIIAVADALDTMLSPRTYKAAYSLDHVRGELRRGAGSQFDPDVASLALELMDTQPVLFGPRGD